MKVKIYHNILWSRYKGEVFSSINLHNNEDVNFDFTQIAETEAARVSLSKVDLDHHRYKYRVLFNGAYESIPKIKLYSKCFFDVLLSTEDIILLPGYSSLEYWFMLFACILRGVPRGVFCDSTINDREQSRIKGVFKSIFFKKCNIFFCYGERSSQYLQKYGAPKEKIHTRCQAAALPIGYSIDVVKSRKYFPENPIFLYVGRFSPEKNILELIEFFARFKSEGGRGVLKLIGNGPDFDKIKINVDQKSNSDEIILLGSLSQFELQEEYLKSTGLILPSISEPWGLVVNESLSYGCPVIVNNLCGCVPELVIEGITGFSFETGDYNKFYFSLNKIIEMTEKNPSETIDDCMAVIAKYTPAVAASQIVQGCLSLYKKYNN